MRLQFSSLSCAFVSGFLLWRVDASCYYPDGTFPTDYVYAACSGDEFSSCCIPSEGDQCLSNGLCYYPSSGGYDYIFRGACTDKTWKSDKCFQHCNSGDASGSYNRLVPCGDDRYCCSSDGSTCCNDDSKVFNVAAASVIKDLASTGTLGLPIATPTDTAESTNTAPADFVTDPTSSAGTKSNPTGSAGASKASNTAVGATSTSDPQPTDQASSTHTSKIPLIAGAIGGAVILIAAIGLVWFLVRRRYRKKLAECSNNYPLSSSDGFQKLPDKTPRPVEVPAPLHSPAPPYQPPPYGHGAPQFGAPQNGAVEIDNSYRVPAKNQYGQPIYEAPAVAYGL